MLRVCWLVISLRGTIQGSMYLGYCLVVNADKVFRLWIHFQRLIETQRSIKRFLRSYYLTKHISIQLSKNSALAFPFHHPGRHTPPLKKTKITPKRTFLTQPFPLGNLTHEICLLLFHIGRESLHLCIPHGRDKQSSLLRMCSLSLSFLTLRMTLLIALQRLAELWVITALVVKVESVYLGQSCDRGQPNSKRRRKEIYIRAGH